MQMESQENIFTKKKQPKENIIHSHILPSKSVKKADSSCYNFTRQVQRELDLKIFLLLSDMISSSDELH